MKEKKQAPYRKRPMKKKKRRLWPWLILLVIVFFISAAAGAMLTSSSLFDKVKSGRAKRTNRTNETLLVATDKTTVMILGVDERIDDIGRADTLMLATIDPKKNQVSVLSIPRDTRVMIQDGYDKINAAYAYGGWQMTRDVVEDLLDTPVDHYVLVNTHTFPRIIDAIGGIDLYVESRMYYVDEWDDATPGGLVINLYPGLQHMDGLTAMAYVRYRDEDGDIGRINRQQRFMQAVMDKVTSPAIIPQLPDVIRQCRSAVETDLSLRQLLELAGSLKEAQSRGLRSEMLAGRPIYIDEVSYWMPDLTENRTRMASTLGISMSQEARSEMEREHRAYEASIPDTAVEASDGLAGEGRRGSDGLRPNRPLHQLPPSPVRDPYEPGGPEGVKTPPLAPPEHGEAEEEEPERFTPAILPEQPQPKTAPASEADEADTSPASLPTPEPPAAPAAPAAPAPPSMMNSGKGQ